MENSTCRLCLRDDVELQDSHVLPKWAYRHVCGNAPDDRDPVKFARGTAATTSLQIKQTLLCRACETRFSDHERYVSTLAYARGIESPLASAIAARGWSGMVDGAPLAYAQLPELNGKSLAFFGASVFWRSHVADAHGSGSVNLGQRYGEELRRYLLGEAAFPEHAAIHMAVVDARGETSDFASMSFASPHLVERDLFRHYRFPLCGLVFELFVGARIPTDCRRRCLARSAEAVVILAPPGRLGAIKTVAAVALAAECRGKLAQVVSGRRAS